MGLISVLQEFELVFQYLRDVWSALPNMIQLLVYVSFGLVVFLAVLKSIWGRFSDSVFYGYAWLAPSGVAVALCRRYCSVLHLHAVASRPVHSGHYPVPVRR